MESFGGCREAELKKFLELPNGIPGESTFLRVFRRIRPEQMSQCLYGMPGGSAGNGGSGGKHRRENDTGRHGRYKNPVHVVSARAGDEEIAPGQAAADEKSNEITAIPKLPELPDIKGPAVTIDAMGCQTEIAAGIRKKQAGYILAAKDNRPMLHEDIREYFAGIENGDIAAFPAT